MATGRYISFVCPHCDGNTLEEVSRGVIYNTISGFYEEYPDYADQEHEQTEVLRYQCFDCGETIIEGYTIDLFKTLTYLKCLDIEEETERPNWEV